MASMQFDKFDLLSEPVARDAFRIVVDERSVPFQGLVTQMNRRLDDQAGRQEIRQAVEQLVEANLVAANASPIEDFTTYYVTADGLEMDRYLRRTLTKKSLFG